MLSSCTVFFYLAKCVLTLANLVFFFVFLLPPRRLDHCQFPMTYSLSDSNSMLNPKLPTIFLATVAPHKSGPKGSLHKSGMIND